MSLSAPRVLFGIHSVTPVNRVTKEFYGMLRVLAGSTISLSGETVELKGGSSKYAWAVEDGAISVEISLKAKEYPDFLFELFMGKAPTATGVDTAGTVSTLTNGYGALMNATTGVASVIVIPSTGAPNLKFGRYVLKAVSATTVDVYCASDIDFARGTDAVFSTDSLKVAAAIAVADTSGTTDIATLGLRITGGSGTVALTTGDTATFVVKPPSTKSMTVDIGATTDVFPEFGLIVLGQRRGTNEISEAYVYRCKSLGFPLGMEEKAWSESELKIKGMYDSESGKVLTYTHHSDT